MIPEQFQLWFDKHVEPSKRDLIDVQAYYDGDISIDENKREFMERFTQFFHLTDFEQGQELRNLEQIRLYENDRMLREEEYKIIEEWKAQDTAGIQIEGFDIAKHLILTVVQGHSNAVIIWGEGGIGKSFCCIKTVKEATKDFVYVNGYISPLSFYKALYRNSDKLIILDDVEGILQDDKAIALLKSATWDTDGKRIVSYSTTSDKADDVPNLFEFKGRVIMLCNKIPNMNDVSVSAALSRFINYKIEFSYIQKLKIIHTILDSRNDLNDNDKKRAMDIIKRNTTLATIGFNFRMLCNLIAFIKYDKKEAERLFCATTQEDEDKKVVLELIGSGSVGEQVDVFIKRTGKSRATFYRIKKEVMRG